MDSPPAKKAKESNMISIVVEKWEKGQTEQVSAARIGGYPWRLRIREGKFGKHTRDISLICDKSSEADLWECSPSLSFSSPNNRYRIALHNGVIKKQFASWDKSNELVARGYSWTVFQEDLATVGRKFEVEINAKVDGESWRRPPILDPLESKDGILVVGEENNKISVNKTTLASLSPFFDRLFNGDFKEKNMAEIPIGDVEYEEFDNFIKLVYCIEGASLNDENVLKILDLAGRFELKFIEDRAVSYLLSSSSSYSIDLKLIISERYNLPFMKGILMALCTRKELKKLSESPDWNELLKETMRDLVNMSTLFVGAAKVIPSPEKKDTASNSISIVVKEWEEGQTEQISPVHHIGGYPWLLRIYKGDDDTARKVSLICEKSKECELWECSANISIVWPSGMVSRKREKELGRLQFASWNPSNDMEIKSAQLANQLLTVGYQVTIDVTTNDDGESWRSRPTLDPLAPLDGIIVCGEEKKIPVNRKSLGSQSPYFEELFFGDFKEKDMKEITIGDVEYEEFANIIKLVYRLDGASITDENVLRVRELADRFELKIVEDRVVSFLLSTAFSSISIHSKLLISEQYSLSFMKDVIISQYKRDQLKELSELPGWNKLSKETMQALLKKGVYFKG